MGNAFNDYAGTRTFLTVHGLKLIKAGKEDLSNLRGN
jgi:hypothetical protein